MKKIIVAFVMFLFIGHFGNIYAAEHNGYIVKTKRPVISLFSADDGVTKIGKNLYVAGSLDKVNENFSSNNIVGILPNCMVELHDAEYPELTSDTSFDLQWCLTKIGALSAREKGLTGNGVKVAVMDSGINYNHSDFNQDNILQGYKCMILEAGVDENGETIFEEVNEPSDYAYTDILGHGTMVSGIIAATSDNENGIAGIANNVKIIPIKVTDTKTFYIANLFLGFERALVTDCDVLNVSLGIIPEVVYADNPKNMELLKEIIQQYLDAAEAKGIVVVTSAGNEGDNTVSYPAGANYAIGVGSIDSNLAVSSFSQRNKSVLLTAPGSDITSLSYLNTLDTQTGSGTSYSAPVVTAVVALVKEVWPDATPEQIRQLLKETSIDMGDEGYDINYGYGILSVDNIINKISDKIPNFMITQGKSNSIPRIYIHNNNSNVAFAKGFFAKYNQSKMTGSQLADNISLQNGVSILPFEEDFDSFYLWDGNFIPYAKKYSITE